MIWQMTFTGGYIAQSLEALMKIWVSSSVKNIYFSFLQGLKLTTVCCVSKRWFRKAWQPDPITRNLEHHLGYEIESMKMDSQE